MQEVQYIKKLELNVIEESQLIKNEMIQDESAEQPIKNKTESKIEALINLIKNSNKFKPPLKDDSFHQNTFYQKTNEEYIKKEKLINQALDKINKGLPLIKYHYTNQLGQQCKVIMSSDLKEITWLYDTNNSGGIIKEFFRK